ncbi:MAG: hypothetical protein ACE5KS_07010, partial [Woeseiaceae bacterium]
MLRSLARCCTDCSEVYSKSRASYCRIRDAVIVALVAAWLTAPVTSVAQTDEPKAIEEIQVTATRRPTEVSDVSAALTLISSEAIRGVKLTTDALASQTGVFLQQTTPGQ